MRGLPAVRFVEARIISRRRRSVLLLAAVIAIASGSVMAAAAGARRSSTSYDRFLAWSNGTDAITGGVSVDNSEQADAALTALAHLPQVEASSRYVLVGDGVRLPGGRTLIGTVYPVSLAFDKATMGRVKVLHGRLPSSAALHEGAVGFVAADLLGLRVGDVVEVLVDAEDPNSAEPVTITGVLAYGGGFPSLNGRPDGTIALTPAFLVAHPERLDWTNAGLNIRLRRGAKDLAAFREAINAVGLPFDNIASTEEQGRGVNRLVGIEGRALWLLGAILGATALVVIVQMFRRNAVLAADQLRMAGVLGMSRRGLIASGALGGLRVGAIGAALGAAVAVLVSPLLPVGVSRTADPHVGVHADFVVLSAGALITLLLAAVAGVSGVLSATRPRRQAPPPVTRKRSLVSRLGPVASTGARLALDAPARSRRRVGGGLIGVAAALTALLGTLALGSSFHRVLNDPRLAGGTWDVVVAYDEAGPREEARHALAGDPEVAAFAQGGWNELTVNGQPVYTMFFDPGSGIAPAVDRGRAPDNASEIALGAAELSRLHLSVGDKVKVAMNSGDPPAPVDPARPAVAAVITGRSILASPAYQTLNLGQGGAATTSMLGRLGGPENEAPSFFVRLRHPDRLAAGYQDLVGRLHESFSFPRPDNVAIRSLRNLTSLVNMLLTVLAVLLASALLQRVVVTSRRHRHQMAILRGLGFTPSQVTRSQVVHGALVAIAAAVVALPLGFVAARQAWTRVADYLGVVPRPVVSPLGAAGIVAATVLAGGLVGLMIGVQNRRTTPAQLLRTE